MAMLNMIGWWYIVDGKRQGPVTLATLEKLLQHRILGAQSLVWREGMPQWTPLAAMESLYIDLCNCLILISSIQHQKQVNLWTKNSCRLWLTNWPKILKPRKISTSLIAY
ncbi:DUF4339 domain-containing protein [Sodalis ligni]|uniref:DUF4339 domain-containing protein n=1 Tax=Sodalis ligni TaxID=2697027 RepID=UPI00193F35EF|nr:DUF4339 domain-containing protein [Sodalis ligni]